MHLFTRYCLIILTCITLSNLNSIAQSKQASSHSDVSQDVAAIRETYKRINALTLKKEQYTYEVAGCAEDGKVVCFLNNKTLVKIVESGSIGDGSWVREFYYQDGKCIFCYEQLIGGPAEGKTVTTEYRYYIKRDMPVRCMENAKITPADSKATENIQTAQRLLKAYPAKDFSTALCN